MEGKPELESPEDEMKPRIIVCGLGRTGYKIFVLLLQQGADVMGISDRPLSGKYSQRIVVGEAKSTATLIQAGIQSAQTLVLAHSDDALNLAILTQARVINPRIRIVNRLFNDTLGERLDQTLPDHVSLSVTAIAAPIFSFAALGNRAIGQLKIFEQTWPIQEVVIDEHHPWRDMPLSDLWDNPSRMLIYYLPAQEEIDLVSAVVQGKRLQRGDHIIVGTQPTVRSKRRSLWQKAKKALANLQRYHHYIRPVIAVSLALLSLIFLATVTYVSTNYNTNLVDSLYFSVGMITGAGGQEHVAESAPPSIKIFTAVMMIVGAGVIGICYALLNDFILGSRLKQFWDVARIPTHGHYVICGLGGIGIHVARQLQQQGYEVVVIERDGCNRFLTTARSLGIPVILEDACLATTLKTANVQNAAAILIVTSDDTINLEIALTAKAVAPKLAIILRNKDEQFAQSVQDVFEFETVLCASDLATHAFAAAALGGKILGNGMTADLLWVAVATLITPKHPFCGKSIKQASIEADFVPLYLERKTFRIHSWELLEIGLQPGDVLYLTMPATQLELIWRSTVSEMVSDRAGA
jgi:Trk K+ transport system NAD-binding subunit